VVETHQLYLLSHQFVKFM